MNDLGFGMLDKRSVAAILFSLGLAAALGLQIPIDTANIGKLFVDVVLLTGFLYICRSIFRLIIILIAWISMSRPTSKDVSLYFSLKMGDIETPNWTEGDSGISLSKLSWFIFDSGYSFRFVRLLDRLILIGVVLIACQFTINQYVRAIGIMGITIMLLIYIFRGGFTFVVKDAVDAANEGEENRFRWTENKKEQKELRKELGLDKPHYPH